MFVQKSCFQLLPEDIDISRGDVSTHLRCGEIFSDNVLTNFPPIPTVKRFENWSIFDEVIKRTVRTTLFIMHEHAGNQQHFHITSRY